MRLVNIDDCNRELFYKQSGGKDSLITVESVFNMFEALPTAYDIDKVVAELEMEMKASSGYSVERVSAFSRAIEIVKQGGVADDVCEWNVFDNSLTDEPQWVYETTCGKYVGEEHTSKAFVYCPYCGNKIKIVGD